MVDFIVRFFDFIPSSHEIEGNSAAHDRSLHALTYIEHEMGDDGLNLVQV